MKKYFGCLLSLVLICNTSFAAPDGIISKYYYKTSAKQELIGYWYQSCYLGFSTLWGTREGFSVADPAMHGWDCTQLGVSANNRGFCYSQSFQAVEIVETVWDENLNKYIIKRSASSSDVLTKASECNQEHPLW